MSSVRIRLFTALALAGSITPVIAQKHTKYETLNNAQIERMLATAKSDILEHYYDPAMHGLDLVQRFEEARLKIASAASQNEAFLYLAGAVASLNDSHTRFIPPPAPYAVEYGWMAQAVGDSCCYVTHVRADSDAAGKGLHAGDQILSINGVKLTRENLSAVEYGYRVFPQSGLRLEVHSHDGSRTILALSKVIPGQRYIRHNDLMAWLSLHADDEVKDRSSYHREGDVFFWKLPDFLSPPEIIRDSLEKTRSYKALVLDLRGNPGGNEAAMSELVGGLFLQNVEIGFRRGRGTSESVIAKSRGPRAFQGRLVVLIDSRSCSSAEIFARVVQLEKRGIVVGDHSAGAAMVSRLFLHTIAMSATTVTTYGVQVTEAGLTMSDGGTLEKVGVTPDEVILPTAEDIAAGRDPALARASSLAGVEMTAEQVGRVFPFEWPKEQPAEIN